MRISYAANDMHFKNNIYINESGFIKLFKKLLKSEVIFKTLLFTVLFIVVGPVPILSKMNVMELASIS